MVWQAKGVKPSQLEGPECPVIFMQMWDWFLRLNARRQRDMNGPLPITFTELRSWRDLMDVDLLPFDVDILMRLDDVVINRKGA